MGKRHLVDCDYDSYCYICFQGYKGKRGLNTHVSKVHSKPNRAAKYRSKQEYFKCQTCKTKFVNFESFSLHELSHNLRRSAAIIQNDTTIHIRSPPEPPTRGAIEVDIDLFDDNRPHSGYTYICHSCNTGFLEFGLFLDHRVRCAAVEVQFATMTDELPAIPSQ